MVHDPLPWITGGNAAWAGNGALNDAKSNPANGVPAWPNAMELITPVNRYSSSARPTVFPLIGKLTIFTVAFDGGFGWLVVVGAVNTVVETAGRGMPATGGKDYAAELTRLANSLPQSWLPEVLAAAETITLRRAFLAELR